MLKNNYIRNYQQICCKNVSFFFDLYNKLNSLIEKDCTTNLSYPEHHFMKNYEQGFWESFDDNERNYFGQQLFEITPRYIKTSYGQVYSLTAGSPGQPLILVVHGSGPRNSSNEYVYLLHQYLVRISYLEKFYIVAIDCPGYGKSIGSKEAVKTFPKQLFEEILSSLKYKQYFAMLGHSQGGAAIFNAVFQNPSLTEYLVMDRPVCGSIQRFRKFNLPILLIYDIEDDGHPIWQGKLLYKELAYSDLFTYRNSQDTYWVPDNIWDKMLTFFSKYSLYNRKARTNAFSNNFRAVSVSPTIQQKSRSKPSKNIQNRKQKVSPLRNAEIKNKKISKKEQSISSQKPLRKTHSLSLRKHKFVQEQRIPCKKINIEQLEQVQELQLQKQDLLSVYSRSLSDSEKQKLRQMEEEMKEKELELLKDQKKVVLGKGNDGYHIKEHVVIESINQKSDEKKQQQAQSYKKKPTQSIVYMTKETLKQQQSKQESKQQDDYKCAICLNAYYRPMQTNCNHIFCTKCLLQSLLTNTRCPLCRTNITKKTQKKQLHQQIIAKMSKQDIDKKEKAYLRLKLMLDSIVYIEIGNRCVQLQTKKSHFSKTKKKFMWELFANEKSTFKFSEVSFNINMGDPYSKPVRVFGGPFVFESRGTFSFSCQIIIKPKNNQYAPITSIYRINLQPGVHKQVIAFRKKIYLKG